MIKKQALSPRLQSAPQVVAERVLGWLEQWTAAVSSAAAVDAAAALPARWLPS